MASTTKSNVPDLLPLNRCVFCKKAFDPVGTAHVYCRMHADCCTVKHYHPANCDICCDLLSLAEQGTPEEAVKAIVALKYWAMGYNSPDRWKLCPEEKKKICSLYKKLILTLDDTESVNNKKPALSAKSSNFVTSNVQIKFKPRNTPNACSEEVNKGNKTTSNSLTPHVQIQFSPRNVPLKPDACSEDNKMDTKRSVLSSSQSNTRSSDLPNEINRVNILQKPKAYSEEVNKKKKKTPVKRKLKNNNLSGKLHKFPQKQPESDFQQSAVSNKESRKRKPKLKEKKLSLKEFNSAEMLFKEETLNVEISEPPYSQKNDLEAGEVCDIDIKEEAVEDFEFVSCDGPKEEVKEENVEDRQVTDSPRLHNVNDVTDSPRLHNGTDSLPPNLAASFPSLMQQLIPQSLISREIESIQERLASHLWAKLTQSANVLLPGVNESVSKVSESVSKVNGSVSEASETPSLPLNLGLNSTVECDSTNLFQHSPKKEVSVTSLLPQNVSDSLISSNSSVPEFTTEYFNNITDKEIVSLSVRELNRILNVNNIPKGLQNQIKRRRRTLKNRSYAQNCRSKRVANSMQLKMLVKQLRKENAELKEQVIRLEQERNSCPNCDSHSNNVPSSKLETVKPSSSFKIILRS